MAKDLKTIETFEEGRDLYLEIAQEITGKPEEECREFRETVKIIVLGLINGMSEYSVHEKINEEIGVNMSLEEVRLLINRFFELHPSIKHWRDESVREARTKGFISTPLGRYLHVDEDTKTTTLFNFPIQGTGADGFKMALLDLQDRLKGMDAKCVHTMHDEIIVEAKAEIAEKVAGILEECMIKPFEPLVPFVPFKVELKIQDSWGF